MPVLFTPLFMRIKPLSPLINKQTARTPREHLHHGITDTTIIIVISSSQQPAAKEDIGKF